MSLPLLMMKAGIIAAERGGQEREWLQKHKRRKETGGSESELT